MWLRWEFGRVNATYSKLLLFCWKWWFPCDLYLLKYESGAYISPHTDPVTGYRHIRINLVLKKPKNGGLLHAAGRIYGSCKSRLHIFYSDKLHAVTKTVGTRWVLSFGFGLKIDRKNCQEIDI